MSSYKNKSPAKQLRNLKRLLTFICNKSTDKSKDTPKSLSISQQETVSIAPLKPQPNLDVSPTSSRDIPPNIKKILNLDVQKSQQISIPPRTVYHPAIINASQRFFAKHPSELSQDEVEKFTQYRRDKAEIGEPLESEEIYLPMGGFRICLNCRELT